MSNDFFSLRDLRTSRSKNFLDADDVPVLTLEDSLEPGGGYLPWRQHGRGRGHSAGSSSPEEAVDLRRPVAASAGRTRKQPPPPHHAKQGHSSIEDFFAKRDRRKNRKAAGRLVPAEVARRILEINARHSAGDAPLDGEGPPEEQEPERSQRLGLAEEAAGPAPGGWELEPTQMADGDGESVTDGSWFAGEATHNSRLQEELQVSWEEGYSALQTRNTGAYLPPQLRQRHSDRARLCERRSFGGLQGAAGGGQASAPDIGCLYAFPALGGGGGGGVGGGWGCRPQR